LVIETRTKGLLLVSIHRTRTKGGPLVPDSHSWLENWD